MRKRAKPSPLPAPTPAPPAAAVAPPEPKKQTKYDELVDVLADGLFEVMMTEPPTAALRAPRRTPERP